MSEGGDIAYRIYRKCPLEEGVAELIPLHRVDSHLIMEQGEIACDAIGMCKFQTSVVYISCPNANMFLKMTYNNDI